MAESKTLVVVPLNGGNYSTWKVQCRMALMKEGLWGLVNGTEADPEAADRRAAYAARKDKALAIIVLAIETKLLYLVGDPVDPQVVWEKLANQFQKKSWANKLELKRKLFSMKLTNSGSVQEHVKAMTEVLDELSIVDVPVKEEDRVVYLLASLPDSYSMLVTALEANVEVPKLEVVTERLLHEERKQKTRSNPTSESGTGEEEALAARYGKGPRCHYCKKLGHIKRNCNELVGKFKGVAQDRRRSAYRAAVQYAEDSSGEEGTGLLVSHALTMQASNLRGKWIVDSGATSHMCNNQHLFGKFRALTQHLDVTLGDGHALKATARGTVTLVMNVPNCKDNKCTLHDVLLVPDLAYNLFSVSKATEAGKSTEFTKSACSIREAKGNKLVAQGYKEGSLYYLDHQDIPAQAHAASSETWHRRFGHFGTQNLMQLSKHRMVRGLKLNPGVTGTPMVCEPCLKGRQHRSPFPVGKRRAAGPLDLVHSDVCGKVGSPSLSGSEYFVTFIDSYSHYTWVYVLKRKDQVFESFLKWQALVENSTGRKVKVLRSDNGGEYTSRKFKEHLSQHGIRHETTVPKNPEQNDTAERMNRTLMESVRSMLADSGLPQRFWAEALSTAVYLRNRSPTKSLPETTPFEVWSGEKPDVSHLRVFGCNAYSHVPRDERGKLDSKTRKCWMLGYGSTTKGYRLYDQNRKRVFYSRDVTCDEQEIGFQKEIPSQDSPDNEVQKEISNQGGEPVEIDSSACMEISLRKPLKVKRILLERKTHNLLQGVLNGPRRNQTGLVIGLSTWPHALQRSQPLRRKL